LNTRKPEKRPPFTSSEGLDLVAWSALALTAIGTVLVMVKAFAEQDWLSVEAAGFLFFVTLVVFWLLLRRHRPERLPEINVFHPFGELDAKSVWRRPTDTQRVVEAILESRPALPVVVGASGVGKSVLMEIMVREQIHRLRKDTEYTVVSDGYEELGTHLESLIPESELDADTVIVLDQFEQWLAHVVLKSAAARNANQEWLRAILLKVRDMPNCQVVLSLRSEWYYELSFLGDLIPSPGRACDIQGPKVRSASTMRKGMLASLDRVLKDEDLAAEVLGRLGTAGRLSPLKVQIVGAFIESRINKGDPFDLDFFDSELGGETGAIDAYFKMILNGAARPSLCMKILCALSLKTRFRDQTPLHDIRASLFERDEAVTSAGGYLIDHGLIASHGGTYELSHDFLAEWFNSKSGTELHPIERDNIFAYIGAGGEHNDVVLSAEQRAQQGRIRWGLIAIFTLLVVMTVRLFYFGVDCTIGPSLAHPVAGSLLDSTYILILTPYAAWILYVSLFYDRVLINLKESPAAHAFSVFIVLNLIFSTLLGIVVPFAWLIGIATGGLAFAGKLLWLSRRPNLNQSARGRLSEFGMTTLGNIIFVGVVGAINLYVSFTYVQEGDPLGTWLAFNLLASALMTYWCLILTPRHVSRSGVSQLLGLIGRPNPVRLAHAEA